MNLADWVAKVVAFVRTGYPRGVSKTDYFPLLALLRRRLSDDEVSAVAKALAARGELNVETADIGAAITRITDELPSSADVDRVKRRLVLQVKIEALTAASPTCAGWPAMRCNRPPKPCSKQISA